MPVRRTEEGGESVDNKIVKAASVTGAEVSEEMLAKINAHTIRPLTADEVFVFRVAMCDNEIDRDWEAFTRKALDELAELYRGKTVIADHRWQTSGQVARIFDTMVEETGGQSGTGEAAARLVAHCYMLRSEANADLIAAIEGGIKKEVSVGCAVNRCECSVCGANLRKEWCDHRSGKEYEGALRYVKLMEAVDAYELSFVAVPAQREAGVVKSYGAEKPSQAKDKETSGDAEGKLRIAEAFLFAKKKKER
jgi:hypothetical protein